MVTRPGRCACLDHRGSWETVADSCCLVCDHWMTATRSIVADDPAIEVQSVRRDRQPRDSLFSGILAPPE